MTQVQEWSNAELNRKLAELMGYTVEVYETFSRLYYNGRDSGWLPGAETAWKQIPDYAGDPAASLEVQTAVIAKNQGLYVRNLEEIVHGRLTGWTASVEVIAYMLTASPRERAEAAYITLQGAQT